MKKTEEILEQINELKTQLQETETIDVIPEKVEDEQPKESELKLTCYIQIAKQQNGLPVLDVQGNLVDAIGLLEYAMRYVKKEVDLFIDKQRSDASQGKEE